LKQNAESVYAQMLMASRAVKSYEDQIVPSALRAYKQASEGYNLGRFSFLELLDAQRTLYEMQGAMLSSLLKLHNAKAQIDFLMGAHINLIQNNNPIIKGE
jgi:cobalt-zinc-cadmium efflux system outer membrane protein